MFFHSFTNSHLEITAPYQARRALSTLLFYLNAKSTLAAQSLQEKPAAVAATFLSNGLLSENKKIILVLVFKVLHGQTQSISACLHLHSTCHTPF